MKLHCLVLVVLLISGNNASPDIGDFFESIFKVFKPSSEEVPVTSAPNVTTSVANITEAASTTSGITVEPTNEAKQSILETTTIDLTSADTTTEPTTEDTTVEDTTIVTSEPSTADVSSTTVIYKLFHPNTTTTETTSTLSTTLAVDLSNSTADSASSTSQPESTTSGATSETSTQTIAASTTPAEISPTASDNDSTTLVLPLASSTVVDGTLCKVSSNPETNQKVTTCAVSSLSSIGSTSANSTESTTQPSTHKPSKRFAPQDDEEEVAVPSEEIGDDDYDISEESSDEHGEGDGDNSEPTIDTNRQ